MKSSLCFLVALVATCTGSYAAEAGMPQLDPTYWASQAFWLILIFTILYISISKFYLPKIKDNLGNQIEFQQLNYNAKNQLIKGKIGKDLDTEAGYNAAKRCALSIIAQVKKACNNDLSKVKSCVKLTGFVNSTDEFIDQPKVLNGASDLIASVFGDAGMHTRAAVSTNSLPLGVSVEVDAIFELK